MSEGEAKVCLSEAPFKHSTPGLAPGPTVMKIFEAVICNICNKLRPYQQALN
jgi:hypothetical protein